MAIHNGQATLTATGSLFASMCAADYCYTMSGGLRFLGCSTAGFTENFITLFDVGDVLYDCYLARTKGKLEAVAIKKIEIVDGYAFYVDTFNWTWGEGDLCTLDEATELVTNYIERRNARAMQELERSCGGE